MENLKPYNLGMTGKKEAIPYLTNYLADGSISQRKIASSAVKKIIMKFPEEADAAIPYLINNLLHEDDGLREYILKMIVDLTLPEHTEHILNDIAQNDACSENRNLARKILEKGIKHDHYETAGIERDDSLNGFQNVDQPQAEELDLKLLFQNKLSNGIIKNKHQLIEMVTELGLIIHRDGHNYIGLRLPGRKQSFRIKHEFDGPEKKGSDDFISTSVLGRIVGIPNKELFLIFEKSGLIYKNEGRQWRLTESGMNKGGEYRTTPKGHAEYIVWPNSLSKPGELEQFFKIGNEKKEASEILSSEPLSDFKQNIYQNITRPSGVQDDNKGKYNEKLAVNLHTKTKETKKTNQQQAEMELKKKFGFNKFFDEQWKTIDLLFKGKRVLLIEKTGFGKSLCYQFPATQFDGLTIIFSPLIALMRDQVKNLNDKGIKAKYINSEQSVEENTQTIQDAIDGKIKILYVAPERQENQEWLEAVRSMDLSMIVIDEAHTISVWGHDFRPAFRRIINLVKLLPQYLPVLATTATATKRVQLDIEKQISGDIISIRGELIRENFELYVIKVTSEDEKLIWMAENFTELKGTGIIYTGTRVNTEIYSRWLEFLGFNTTEYNAGLDAVSRKRIENGLMGNKWKAVVSTNALGMGIDKPDIRFIIHTQIPASPIHYYQEIGRAGRDGNPTKLILFYNSTKDKNGIEEDYRLPKSFIDGGRPSLRNYNKVINALQEEQLGERQIIKATNLSQNQVRIIKADLIEQGIIKEVFYGKSKKYEYQYTAPELNTDSFEKLRQTKLDDLSAMVDYVNLKSSRMKYLCDYLGDTSHTMFGNCDNTTLQKFISNPTEKSRQQLADFRESYFPILKVATRKSNIINGVAASYYGVSNVGAALHRSKYEGGGDFPDFILSLTLKAFRKKYHNEKFDYLVYVPPTESGDLVKNFAEKIARALKIPSSHELVKKEKTKPQKIFKNAILKRDNVYDKFDFKNPDRLVNKTILLVDDIFDSGATIREIGKILTKYGAAKIAPLVIARTVGGDI
jgi:ATP-dependent DNA helicase RecQ